MSVVTRRFEILLFFFFLFYRIFLIKREIMRDYLKEFKLEEETKWQELLLQNREVSDNKFFLFLRTIVEGTRLYIRPCSDLFYFLLLLLLLSRQQR
jgi:hypothetical protein